MATIQDIRAREIIDSGGNPTVEADVMIDSGVVARAAVPSAGPIAGLGNRTPARPIAQTPLPSISPALADKLTALAAQSAAPIPKTAEPTKPKANEETDARERISPQAAIPPAQVPHRMIDTLERYERMKAASVRGG